MKTCIGPRRFFLIAISFLTTTTQATRQGLQITTHEWGTFTTVSSSDGRPLPGLFIDASPLPGFVNTLPFFAGAPAPSNRASGGLVSDSALALKWRGIATKMETPVLYFYTDYAEPISIQVTARFPKGTIHQFYPPRQDGEENPTGDGVDFTSPREGRITWNAEILPQKLSDTTYSLLTHPNGGNSPEWLAPRRPRSNLIRAGGEIESYLFYRGLAGELPLPLKLRFTGDSTLEISNTGNDSIARVVVYDQTYSAALLQAGTVWWQGSLRPKETLVLRLDTVSLPHTPEKREEAFQGMKSGLRLALQSEGLTLDEAEAMMNTWDRSYWGDERGFKVFWIVPRAVIDTLLPLTIQADLGCNYTTERVFIARSEILLPAFERSLQAGISIDPHDRLRLAFQAFKSMPPVSLQGARRPHPFHAYPLRPRVKGVSDFLILRDGKALQVNGRQPPLALPPYPKKSL